MAKSETSVVSKIKELGLRRFITPALVVLGLASGGYAALSNVSLTSKPLTPAEAIARPGEKAVTEFAVASAGKKQDGSVVYLNSTVDYKQPTNLVVKIDGRALPQYAGADPRAAFVGKTVRVEGAVTKNRFGGNEILVTDAKQLTLK